MDACECLWTLVDACGLETSYRALGFLCDQVCTREYGTQGFDIFWVPPKTCRMNNHLPSGNEDRLQCLVTPLVCGGSSLSTPGICLEFVRNLAGSSLTPNTLEMFLCDLWLRTSFKPFPRESARGHARDPAFKKCNAE